MTSGSPNIVAMKSRSASVISRRRTRAVSRMTATGSLRIVAVCVVSFLHLARQHGDGAGRAGVGLNLLHDQLAHRRRDVVPAGVVDEEDLHRRAALLRARF